MLEIKNSEIFRSVHDKVASVIINYRGRYNIKRYFIRIKAGSINNIYISFKAFKSLNYPMQFDTKNNSLIINADQGGVRAISYHDVVATEITLTQTGKLDNLINVDMLLSKRWVSYSIMSFNIMPIKIYCVAKEIKTGELNNFTRTSFYNFPKNNVEKKHILKYTNKKDHIRKVEKHYNDEGRLHHMNGSAWITTDFFNKNKIIKTEKYYIQGKRYEKRRFYLEIAKIRLKAEMRENDKRNN